MDVTHTLHPFTLPYYWLSPSILAQLHYIMAKKTLSEHVKKAKQTQLKETKPKEAVDMYQHEQSKPVHLQKGACKIAKEYGIPTQYKTITNQYNRGQSTAAMYEDHQKLKPFKEQTLVNFLIESAECGFPQTLNQLENFANLIQQSRLGPECERTGGADWESVMAMVTICADGSAL